MSIFETVLVVGGALLGYAVVAITVAAMRRNWVLRHTEEGWYRDREVQDALMAGIFWPVTAIVVAFVAIWRALTWVVEALARALKATLEYLDYFKD